MGKGQGSPTNAHADLLVCGSAPEVYRLSLSEGRFLTPLPLRSPAANACALSPAHGLFGAAGEDGCLECFDLRQRSSVGRVDVASAADAVRAFAGDLCLRAGFIPARLVRVESPHSLLTAALHF